VHFTSLRLGNVPETAGRYTRPNAGQGLKTHHLNFRETGTLDSRPSYGPDGCRASCVDWYGNSRPLFLKGRVFALLGYEIVEGRMRAGRIEELRRVNFSPAG